MTQAQMQQVGESEAYKDFELRHNRHLNMMSDNVSILRSCQVESSADEISDDSYSNLPGSFIASLDLLIIFII